MKRPNFLIIGAQKAGTTWLWQRISQHPDVFVPDKKELSFFNRPRKRINDQTFLDQYMPHFKGSKAFKRVGESTPGYFWTTDPQSRWCHPPHAYNDQIPETVNEFLGKDVRLILCLRNPIERAISAFFHHFRHTKVIEPNHRILEIGHRLGIVDMGFYFRHLTKWLEVFPRENLLIFEFERDICHQPDHVMHQLFNFLDLTPCSVKDLHKPAFAGLKLNLSEDRSFLYPQKNAQSSPVVYRDEVEKLCALYHSDLLQLARLLDWDVTRWIESSNTIFPKRSLRDIFMGFKWKKPKGNTQSNTVSKPETESKKTKPLDEAQFFGRQNNAQVRAASWSSIPFFQHQIHKHSNLQNIIAQKSTKQSNTKALTLACGDMSGEYQFLKNLGVASIEAYDISPGQRDKFFKRMQGKLDIDVHYIIGDVNTMSLKASTYDVVYVQQAFHHFEALEHVSQEIHKALKPSGLFVLIDYVGKNFLQRTETQKRVCQYIWDRLPEKYRKDRSGKPRNEIHIPKIKNLSPCEAIRAEDILEILTSRFKTEHMFAYGAILYPLINGFSQNYDDSQEDLNLLKLLWDLDRLLIETQLVEPNFVRAVFKK